MPNNSKTFEFSEKFQTAIEPPPLIFGKKYCNFFPEIYDRSIVYNGKNLQYKFLDWKFENDPPRNFSEYSSVLDVSGIP